MKNLTKGGCFFLGVIVTELITLLLAAACFLTLGKPYNGAAAPTIDIPGITTPHGPTISGPTTPQTPTVPGPTTPQNPTIPGPTTPQNPTIPGPTTPQNPTIPEPTGPQNPTIPEPTGPQNPTIPEPTTPQNPTIPEPTQPAQLNIRITFDANGGTGAPADMLTTVPNSGGFEIAYFTVPSTVPQRSGYTFECWNLVYCGLGDYLMPGEQAGVFIDTAGEDFVILLEAAWNEDVTAPPARPSIDLWASAGEWTDGGSYSFYLTPIDSVTFNIEMYHARTGTGAYGPGQIASASAYGITLNEFNTASFNYTDSFDGSGTCSIVFRDDGHCELHLSNVSPGNGWGMADSNISVSMWRNR